MSHIIFPLNENTFIENIMDEVKDLDDTDEDDKSETEEIIIE